MYIVRVMFLNGNEREFPFQEKELAETFFIEMRKMWSAFVVLSVDFEEVANV